MTGFEYVSELAEYAAELNRASQLRRARDAANPFDQVATLECSDNAKVLATALTIATEFDDVWPILRFHRRMGGPDLAHWFCGSPAFALWMQGEVGLEVVDFDDLRGRAEAWLKKHA